MIATLEIIPSRQRQSRGEVTPASRRLPEAFLRLRSGQAPPRHVRHTHLLRRTFQKKCCGGRTMPPADGCVGGSPAATQAELAAVLCGRGRLAHADPTHAAPAPRHGPEKLPSTPHSPSLPKSKAQPECRPRASRFAPLSVPRE